MKVSIKTNCGDIIELDKDSLINDCKISDFNSIKTKEELINKMKLDINWISIKIGCKTYIINRNQIEYVKLDDYDCSILFESIM